jgi:hypothetical protein
MPIRKYEEGIFDTTSVMSEKESKHRLAKAAVAVGGAGIALFMANGIGNADNTNWVVYGGMGHPDGQPEVGHLIATGQINGNDNVFPVWYPASIAPLGPVSFDQSTAEGVVNGQHILDTQLDPNKRTIVYGYSEGTKPAAVLVQNNGGVQRGELDLIIDKGPLGPTGVFSNPTVQMFEPITDAFGIDTSPALPDNALVLSNDRDVWSGGANENLGGLISDGISTMTTDSHAETDRRAPHFTEQVPNNTDGSGGIVTVESYGGAPVQAVNAPAPEGAPEAARSDAPSFFGEAPCFAADGSQYFTPADAPC